MNIRPSGWDTIFLNRKLHVSTINIFLERSFSTIRIGPYIRRRIALIVILCMLGLSYQIQTRHQEVGKVSILTVFPISGPCLWEAVTLRALPLWAPNTSNLSYP